MRPLRARRIPGCPLYSSLVLGLAGLTQDGPAQRGFTLWQPLTWYVPFLHAGEAGEAAITVQGPNRFDVRIGEAVHRVERIRRRWSIDGVMVAAEVVCHAAGVSVFWGNGYHFSTPERAVEDGQTRSGTILAPMPGQIISVDAASGHAVKEGDTLVVLEAMKIATES